MAKYDYLLPDFLSGGEDLNEIYIFSAPELVPWLDRNC